MKKAILFVTILLYLIGIKNVTFGSENTKLDADTPEIQDAKRRIISVVKQYYSSWKSKDYKKVVELTTDKEQKTIEDLIKKIRRNNNTMPPEMAAFLNRFSSIEITESDIEVAPEINNAYAECRLLISSNNSSGFAKMKVVSYLLILTDAGWKIKFSKPLGDIYEKVK